MEFNRDHLLGIALNGESELLVLRNKLMEVNENNVTSTESIDSLYLTYITLLSYGEEMELGLSYKLLSDKIVGISKMLNNTPYSIGKYLGFTLILSIWILKSQDWYNLDDLSSTDVCNVIIKLMVDCCNTEHAISYEFSQDEEHENLVISGKSWMDEWGEPSNSYFGSSIVEDEEIDGVVEIKNETDMNILNISNNADFTINKKRRLDGIVSGEYEDDFKYIVFEITKINIDSLNLLFEKRFSDDLFTTFQNINFKDNTQKNIFFNKIFFLNSIICFYRCSGSFLMTALVFKLPRGRYLLENGVEMVADHLLKEILYSYKKSAPDKVVAMEDNAILALDDISAILWFKTFEAKISTILENKIQELSNESLEKQEVDKEYQKMELLNNHSNLINKVFAKFIDYNLNRSNQIEFLPKIFNKIRIKLVKTILGAIHTTFSIPFISRNHFMAHFHIHDTSNGQILNLFFNIGYLAQLSIQNCFSEVDIIIQILKTYNSTIFLISRFGESSTKQLFIEELSNGLNHNLTPVDFIYQKLKSLLFSDKQIQLSNKSNALHYSLFKFAYSILLDIKSIILKFNYKQKSSNSKIINSSLIFNNVNTSSQNTIIFEKVIYYKIASLFYTLNFINIILDRYSMDSESSKKPLSIFIENFFLNFLSEPEIEQIYHFVNTEINLYNTEKKFFDPNLRFEIDFIKGYLSKFSNKNFSLIY
ncbi:uncharacterized protein cubi_01158 [Cryptosporidium ubiquitum]|uniref:Uncharacterized protein n=1 Tax=Cryptosporidium ubiquitum TaxID=857276 RepID=A0A1J4MJ77_9CRYT|nr:uncharacterized protein cubi_01158 [Cryptosporidium ubiquitum]OII74314.1 hypothetical protein cubi_01158 [Cryptosporidium ubiquitum]